MTLEDDYRVVWTKLQWQRLIRINHHIAKIFFSHSKPAITWQKGTSKFKIKMMFLSLPPQFSNVVFSDHFGGDHCRSVELDVEHCLHNGIFFKRVSSSGIKEMIVRLSKENKKKDRNREKILIHKCTYIICRVYKYTHTIYLAVI